MLTPVAANSTIGRGCAVDGLQLQSFVPGGWVQSGGQRSLADSLKRWMTTGGRDGIELAAFTAALGSPPQHLGVTS
ncbi:MAG: hypothetical protein QM679_02090 [Patulibacter sp.]